MIRIQTLHDLKKTSTDQLVYVETVKKLYRNMDGEWVERAYFTINEAAEIMSVTPKYTREIIRKLNIRPKILRTSSLDYNQLQMLVKALVMRRQEKKYLQIKKELNL